MDRKNVLKDLSATDLRQELLSRLREQIRRNEEENEALRQQIRQLTPQPKSVIVSKSTGKAKAVRGPRVVRRNQTPLRQIMVDIFKKSPEALRVRDIMEQARAAGYVSNANNFAAVISLTLTNNPDTFERVDRGMYQLRQQATTIVEPLVPVINREAMALPLG